MLMSYDGQISVGRRCSVNPYTVLYGHGGLVIEDDVHIAAHCVVIPANHVFSDRDRTIKSQGVISKGIRIASDVWIGANVTVLDEVTIEIGSVIAAGAVVTKSTEPYSINAGVPARKIKSR
jgi:acetyltransferase-like isoleucine patch superfamily enzyme